MNEYQYPYDYNTEQHHPYPIDMHDVRFIGRPFGRPFGIGRPFVRPFGFGYGAPFLGGFIGGLATGALLNRPFGYGYPYYGYPPYFF